MIFHFGLPGGLRWGCWAIIFLVQTLYLGENQNHQPASGTVPGAPTLGSFPDTQHVQLRWEMPCGIECEAGSNPYPRPFGHYSNVSVLTAWACGLASHRLLQHLRRRLLLSERLRVTESERHLAWLGGGRWGWTKQNFFLFHLKITRNHELTPVSWLESKSWFLSKTFMVSKNYMSLHRGFGA